jgi:EAL domain-containing protein (putative c-di-GMP-specific phosphodiesterase class I)
MYHAKNTGKSQFAIFDSKMRMKTIQKKIFENDLRQAFKTEQFFLVYQPIFALNSGRVIGFEALVRWRNQHGEIVMPDDFIPISEEVGIIIDLGDWVLREACKQLRDWKNRFSASFPMSVHVNVSGAQFSQADFVQKLSIILEATGIKQSELKLEISESTLLNFHQRETNLLPELKKAGIHLEIDDFGTGFSSLKFLQKIPVDTLKIDRFFIQDIDKSEKKMELIRAMVNMAKGMKLRTTAEGIETQEQLRLLSSIGCNNGQGFYWSRPVLSNEAERFFENNPKPTDRKRASLS